MLSSVSRLCVSFYTALCVLSVWRKKKENKRNWKAVYCTASSVPLCSELLFIGFCTSLNSVDLPSVFNGGVYVSAQSNVLRSDGTLVSFAVLVHYLQGCICLTWSSIGDVFSTLIVRVGCRKSHRRSHYWYWENYSVLCGNVCDLKKTNNKKKQTVPIKLIHTIIKIQRHMEMNVFEWDSSFMLLNHRRSNLTKDGVKIWSSACIWVEAVPWFGSSGGCSYNPAVLSSAALH